MRIFTVIAAASVLALSVAVAYAHEPPEFTADVKEDGGPPAWVEDVKADGGPPAFVEDLTGATDENVTDENVADEDALADAEVGPSAMGEENANVPVWVADVKTDGGPPAWVEDVKADGGPPAWVAQQRATPSAARR
ncbi:MAG TPA: hypothetical protein VJP45_13790 [Candidatus Limnocylindria bacterium]|nr:hypothetical protein [Candidatus Limnocylindria bacterium]